MLAIETEQLVKSFDNVHVLRGFDLAVPTGQIYGLLGLNGSGKSTLIHLLLGFLRPNRGKVRVLGEHNPERIRGRVGYLPERLRYHMRYTAREYLHYLGRFSDLREPHLSDRVNAELRAVGLLEDADRMLNTYSKGMLQRLGIAQALLHEPELLLIDEPTSGLDPAGQREVFQLLSDLRGQGHTIFLTTHMLDEVEQLCDRVGILFRGKLAGELDSWQLRTTGHNVQIIVASMTPELMLRLQRLDPAVRCQGYEIRIDPNTPELQAAVLRLLLEANVSVISLKPASRNLENFFRRIVSGEPTPTPESPPAEPTPTPESPPAEAEPAPAADVAPGRPSTGETLLRELLSSEQARWRRPDQDQE
jgi:ABC-2 type transport system ATP-binding protein